MTNIGASNGLLRQYMPKGTDLSSVSAVKSQFVVSQRVILALTQLAISSAGTSSLGRASISAIDSGLK